MGSSSSVESAGATARKPKKIDTEKVVALEGLDLSPPTPESGLGSAADSDPMQESHRLPPSSPSQAASGWVDPVKVFKERVVGAGVLKRIPGMPNAINEEYLACLVQAMKIEYWDEGNESTLILEEGAIASRCYVVLDGVVSIMATMGDEGWPQEREKKKAMDYFGEEALVREMDGSAFKANQRYSYSAVVADDGDGNGDGATLLCMDVRKMKAMLESDPGEVVAEHKARQKEKAVAKASSKLSQIRQSLLAEN
eukprot:g1528.t1